MLDSSAVNGFDFHRFLRVRAKVKHPNIVQLLGYCYEIEKELVEGFSYVFTNKEYMALCFEYLHNGSLKPYAHGAMLLDIMT